MSAQRPGVWLAWWRAARPATLPAAIAPVLVGSACAAAAGQPRPLLASGCLLTAVLLQLGANFANDLFDFRRGADTEERLGPPRAVQSGWLSEDAMWLGTWITFAVAAASAIPLVIAGGWVMVALGALAILAAVGYTGGPYPLGYHGFGELLVLFFFGGVAVCATAYVQLLDVPALAWWSAVPMGALATAILVVNNLRDLETDRRAGKRTLAVRFGARATRAEYAILLVVAFLVPLGLVLARAASAWLLLPLATSGRALVLARRVNAEDGRALNPVLGGTARLLLGFGLLLALGVVLGRSASG